MDNTGKHIHALAQAAASIGETSCKAKVAGYEVTVHVPAVKPESAPVSRAQLVVALKGPRLVKANFSKN